MKRRIFISVLSVVATAVLILLSPCVADAADEDKVTLYLQWFHQFQFAGYYAAQEKGYFREKGLNVLIVEGGPGSTTFDKVSSAPGRYGTAHAAGFLQQRAEGKPLVVLANIFQHSPNAILARGDRGINNLHDLKAGRTVIWPGGHVELSAMFLNEGIDPTPYFFEPEGSHLKDLIAGKIDAIDGYITNEAFSIKQAGVPLLILSPAAYGVDFYGDILITSEMEIRNSPERAEAFKVAALRGWKYAVDHQEEIINLIREKFTQRKSNDHLRFEAVTTSHLVMADIVEIGHMNPGRWEHMVGTMINVGMLNSPIDIDSALYDPVRAKRRRQELLWKIFFWSAALIGIFALLFAAWGWIFTLRRSVAKATAELGTSEEKYRNFVETSQDMIWRCDEQGCVIYLNPAWEREVGYRIDEMLGHVFTEFLVEEVTAPDMKEFASLLVGDQARDHETTFLSKSGEPIILNFNAVPLRDAAGSIVGAQGTAQNITERKALEARSRQAQRLEAVGTLAGGIAHNFNNLLQMIMSNASTMKLETDTSHPHHEILTAIINRVKNGAELTSQVLGFARGGKYQTKPTNLNSVFVDATNIVGRTHKELDIHHNLDAALWNTNVDKGQIEQVLMSLLLNAMQAMPHGGQVLANSENVTIDDSFAILHEVAPGRYVKLSVSDDGEGMEKDIQARIFEPFFSTKGMASGSGMGLASAYGIIKNHKGILTFNSEVGKGTTFDIYLPGTEEEIVEIKEPVKEERKGSGTILFVDDDEDLVTVGQRTLRSLGYDVLVASSGIEAVKVFDRNKDKIDLVILDMIMPQMGGGDVFDRLRELKPNVKVLLSSGYSLDGPAKEIMERGCDAFIQKPFDRETFSQQIHELLDQK